LWPGYGENSRVLKWIFERLNDKADAQKTAIGFLPATDSLDIDGLNINTADLEAITSLDTDGWREAVPQIREHFAIFGDRLPAKLHDSLNSLESALA
jgi:phosphoenolpyruvate carboxykinase (GTP)